jgi:4-hydroxybenzoate polyprenyltransferase
VGGYVLLWLLGVIAGLFWYAFWIGLLVIGGTVGYKLFLAGDDEEKPKLSQKQPTAISEMENTDRMLKEYREKLMSDD